MSITPRRAALAVPLLLAAVVLNGCGVVDTQVRPGVAADVAGTEIQQSLVDDTVDGTCDYFDQADTGTQVASFPRVTVRRQLVSVLVQEIAAQHLVDDLDVTLADDYTTAIAAVDQQYTDAPDDQAEAMRTGDKASTYLSYAADAIGTLKLRDETGEEPTDRQLIFARGVAEIEAWLAAHDVELNPTYGLALDQGSFVSDDGLSVPESSEAVAAQSVFDIDLNDSTQDLQTLVPAATDKLPAEQVCGPAAG